MVECAVKIRRRFLEYTKAHLGDEQASQKTIMLANNTVHQGHYVTDRAMAQLGYLVATGSTPKASPYERYIAQVSRDLLARLYTLPEHFLGSQDPFATHFIVCVNAVATMRSQNRHLTKNNNPIEKAARFESLYKEYTEFYKM